MSIQRCAVYAALLWLTCSCFGNALGQEDDKPSVKLGVSKPIAHPHLEDVAPEPRSEWISLNLVALILSTSILLFGVVVLMFLFRLMYHHGDAWNDYSFKLVGLTIIVIGGLFLITAGYSDDQLAPMMGLLGTAIGYILGKDYKTQTTNATSPASNPEGNPNAPT